MKALAAGGVLSAALSSFGGTWYVAPEGNDSNDGKSWATAFATPTQAVNAAYTKGDTVILSNGTYQIAETLNPGNSQKPWLHLRSFTLNPKDVILDGGGTTQILRAGVDAGQKCTIEGMTFRNARQTGSREGAAICFSAATYFSASSIVSGNVVSNCVFLNCHNDTNLGGAILVGSGDKVVDCVFSNCTAMTEGTSVQTGGTLGGGAIYASCAYADIEITRCSFTECGAKNGIGVVAAGVPWSLSLYPYPKAGYYATNSYSAILTDCGFTNNWSYGLQAVCCSLKVRRVTGCTFVGSRSTATTSDNYAGVLGTCESRSLNVPGETNVYANCLFEGNTNEGWAAVLRYDGDVPFVFSNCTFRANSGGGNEGSLIRTAGYTAITDCTIENNETPHCHDAASVLYGGFGLVTFKNTARPCVLRRTVFDGNAAAGAQGIVTMFAPGSEVTDCAFTRNLVTKCGQGFPGILNMNGPANDVLVRGCLFACNTNDNTVSPAQVYVGSTAAVGGKYYGGTNAVIESCTFVGNRTKVTNWYQVATGFAHLCDNGDTARICNCVFTDNRSAATTSFRNFSDRSDSGIGTHYAARYCWEDGQQAPLDDEYGNIRGSDPKFADAAKGDYRAGTGSPLKDAGLVRPWMWGAIDLADVPRLRFGRVDIGAFARTIGNGVIMYLK